jgi:MFS family permease
VSTRMTPVALLEVANLLGGVANACVAILVPWLVLQQTGSAAAAGVVGAAAAVPGVVVSPFVGALVDRLGRRRVSMASDLLSAASVSLFPLLASRGTLTLTMIAALAVLGAAFDPAGYTARKALLPDVARASRMSLDSLNGLHEGVFAAGFVVGPVVAAAGIASLGTIDSFWITAIAFLLAIAAVFAIRVPEEASSTRAEAGEEDEAFWATSLRGVNVLWRDRPLRDLTLAIGVVILVYMPTEVVLLPTLFEARDEPGAYGITLTMLAAGSMVGSFAYGWLAPRFTRHHIAVGVMLTCTAAMIPMALLPPLPVFVTAGFLLGLAWGPMNPLLNTLVQARVPAHVQGRVYGVQNALFYAAPPLGLLLAGVAADEWGVQAVYAVVGGTIALTTLLVAALPTLRGLDEDPVTSVPTPATTGSPASRELP